MNVLHVASEVAPYAKTGGLADVASALPRALAARGASDGDRVAIVTPRHRVDPARFGLARRLSPIVVPLGGQAWELSVLEGRLPGGGHVRAFLIDHPLYDRAGLYQENGRDYPDNALRFALLSRAAIAVAQAYGLPPDVIHAHDWQAAPSLLYARRGAAPRARTILTIHNVAFLGTFPPSTAKEVDFDGDLFHPDGVEFWGNVSFLKAGAVFADWITTVSPRYAREIMTPEFGCGLDGLLRARSDRVVGILNGADYDVWDPSRDALLAARYDEADLDGKARCKAALQRELGLPERPRAPLCAAVSRLTPQKGFDLAAEALEALLPAALDDPARAMQVVVLGSGEPELEDRLRSLQARFPSQVAARFGYDEALAHRIYAGCDLFVMPSRYEPCGLSQLYALRYGAPPIVRATGGLDDTVIDFDPRSSTGTGFKFGPISSLALAGAWRRALAAWRDPASFVALRRRAMQQDFSWSHSADRYRVLYHRPPAEAEAQPQPY